MKKTIFVFVSASLFACTGTTTQTTNSDTTGVTDSVKVVKDTTTVKVVDTTKKAK